MFWLRHIGLMRLLPAFVWLVMQLLMTGLFAPAQALPFDTITICTPGGLVDIDLENIDQEEGAPDGDIGFGGCQWCQSFGQAIAAAKPSVTHVAFQIHPEPEIHDVTTSLRREPSNYSSFQSRAPPN